MMDAVQRGEALKASSNSIAFFRSEGEVMGNGISKTSSFVFHIKKKILLSRIEKESGRENVFG